MSIDLIAHDQFNSKIFESTLFTCKAYLFLLLPNMKLSQRRTVKQHQHQDKERFALLIDWQCKQYSVCTYFVCLERKQYISGWCSLSEECIAIILNWIDNKALSIQQTKKKKNHISQYLTRVIIYLSICVSIQFSDIYINTYICFVYSSSHEWTKAPWT